MYRDSSTLLSEKEKHPTPWRKKDRWRQGRWCPGLGTWKMPEPLGTGAPWGMQVRPKRCFWGPGVKWTGPRREAPNPPSNFQAYLLEKPHLAFSMGDGDPWLPWELSYLIQLLWTTCVSTRPVFPKWIHDSWMPCSELADIVCNGWTADSFRGWNGTHYSNQNCRRKLWLNLQWSMVLSGVMLACAYYIMYIYLLIF